MKSPEILYSLSPALARRNTTAVGPAVDTPDPQISCEQKNRNRHGSRMRLLYCFQSWSSPLIARLRCLPCRSTSRNPALLLSRAAGPPPSLTCSCNQRRQEVNTQSEGFVCPSLSKREEERGEERGIERVINSKQAAVQNQLGSAAAAPLMFGDVKHNKLMTPRGPLPQQNGRCLHSKRVSLSMLHKGLFPSRCCG